MLKIPTLFVRDHTTHRVIPEVVEGCEWVLDGQGIATRKYDGTCCMVKDGVLYKRLETKGIPPEDFEEVDYDENTGKRFGWVPVGDGPEDKWHREAWGAEQTTPEDGTYELLGPKIQGNKEGFTHHTLMPHGMIQLPLAPRTYDELQTYLQLHTFEGIVWWHQDGSKAKLKKRDFPRVNG